MLKGSAHSPSSILPQAIGFWRKMMGDWIVHIIIITTKKRGANTKKKIIAPLMMPGDIQHLIIELSTGPREINT